METYTYCIFRQPSPHTLHRFPAQGIASDVLPWLLAFWPGFVPTPQQDNSTGRHRKHIAAEIVKKRVNKFCAQCFLVRVRVSSYESFVSSWNTTYHLSFGFSNTWFLHCAFFLVRLVCIHVQMVSSRSSTECFFGVSDISDFFSGPPIGVFYWKWSEHEPAPTPVYLRGALTPGCEIDGKLCCFLTNFFKTWNGTIRNGLKFFKI